MTPAEIECLARMAVIFRQDWVLKSTITQLTNYAHSHPERTYQATAHALLWLVLDPDTKTPARLAEAGPWWGSQTVNPKDKPAYYGPTVDFCKEPIADEDGQPRACRMLLHPDEPCTHRRSTGQRRAVIIAEARRIAAGAQGEIKRAEAAAEMRREEVSR